MSFVKDEKHNSCWIRSKSWSEIFNRVNIYLEYPTYLNFVARKYDILKGRVLSTIPNCWRKSKTQPIKLRFNRLIHNTEFSVDELLANYLSMDDTSLGEDELDLMFMSRKFLISFVSFPVFSQWW